MVLDLGKDHYRLSGPALEALGRKVIQGNMEDVLRVYEEEMRVSTSRNDIRAKTASAERFLCVYSEPNQERYYG
jgi:hypothetical protein